MSVEGLWALLTNQHDDLTHFEAGGVVVLESGRVFGGDSAMAYLGSYEVTGSEIAIDVESFTHNPSWTHGLNVFGITGAERVAIRVEAVIKGELIFGNLWRKEAPEQRLFGRLVKIADLP